MRRRHAPPPLIIRKNRALSISATSPTAADVVGLLGDLITNDGLEPGARLPPIRKLALRFGVKAGTVRDALLDAQGKGLIRVLPRVGAIVDDPRGPPATARHVNRGFEELMAQRSQNLFHVLETREVLELTMVARAAQRRELAELFQLRRILEAMAVVPPSDETGKYAELDVQFHLEIGRLSGNSVMTSLLDILLRELKPHLSRIRWSGNQREATNDSHARIYSALVAADIELARSEMRDHIRSAYDSLLDEMREVPSMKGARAEAGSSR